MLSFFVHPATTSGMGILKFNFSSQQINQRIVVESSGTSSARLYKRQLGGIEGKIVYTTLLCEELSKITPAHSLFRVCETFKSAKNELMRCYVRCQHDSKMPVTYQKADLKENSALEFTVNLKCLDCLGRETSGSSQSSPTTSNVSSIPSTAPLTNLSTPSSCALPSISLYPNNPVTLLFEKAAVAITKEISSAFMACLSSSNPESYLVENKVQVGQLILQAWYNATRNLDVATTEDFPDHSFVEAAQEVNQQPENNFNNYMSQAMRKRMREQNNNTNSAKNKK